MIQVGDIYIYMSHIYFLILNTPKLHLPKNLAVLKVQTKTSVIGQRVETCFIYFCLSVCVCTAKFFVHKQAYSDYRGQKRA